MASNSSLIREAIEDFASVQRDKPFHMSDLTEFVQETVVCAPDSAGRELRYMRARGDLNYSCIERKSSLYQFA
jgi:hypothetical protein